MAKFSLEESNVMKIPLMKCEDPDAYIEVGLKATEVEDDGRRDSLAPRTPRPNDN